MTRRIAAIETAIIDPTETPVASAGVNPLGWRAALFGIGILALEGDEVGVGELEGLGETRGFRDEVAVLLLVAEAEELALEEAVELEEEEADAVGLAEAVPLLDAVDEQLALAEAVEEAVAVAVGVGLGIVGFLACADR